MTELTHVQCPMSVSEIHAYITSFSNLKNVLHVFQSFCKYEDALLAIDVMLILEKKEENRKRKKHNWALCL